MPIPIKIILNLRHILRSQPHLPGVNELNFQTQFHSCLGNMTDDSTNDVFVSFTPIKLQRNVDGIWKYSFWAEHVNTYTPNFYHWWVQVQQSTQWPFCFVQKKTKKLDVLNCFVKYKPFFGFWLLLFTKMTQADALFTQGARASTVMVLTQYP